MKIDELKALSVADLKSKVDELEANYFNIRFQAEMGQLENRLMLKAARRDVARAKTLLNEKKA